MHNPENIYDVHRLPQNPLQDTMHTAHYQDLRLRKAQSERISCYDCASHCLWGATGCKVSNWCICFLNIKKTTGAPIIQFAFIFEFKSTAMSRYAHDQNYHNGRSRRSGQQHAHGRGDGFNTQRGQDEHAALGQQSAPAQSHYRMQLNNFLQHRFRSTQGLRLDSSSSGPEHALWWTVIVYFGDCEYSRGEGVTKAAATEIACQIALQALMQSRINH
ncbi:hypothetical protein EDD22DRAFT_608099 [Suillus occidentalis]|nr:hypothetical protein EDD22DRAFT_608099 [Suillus occidentalis]